MKKCEVKEYFTLKKFDELKNLVRASENTTAKYGELFVGDTFDCTEEMCNYLNGNNKYNKSYINIIQDSKKEIEIEKPKERKNKNKKTSKK